MDHSEARQKVCIICYHKASRPLSSLDIEGIQNFVIENYNPENPDLPCAICTPCQGALTKYRNGNMQTHLPIASDYDPGTRVLTRGNSVCSCRICKVAKSNGIAAKSLKRKRQGRPSSEVPNKKFKLCTNCFTMLYQGCNHSQAQCNSKKHQVDNICSNACQLMTKQQVASKVLKELDIGEPNIVQLSTLGKPLQVAVRPE